MYIFAVMLGLIAAGMLGLVIYHFTVAPVDNEPGLGWMFVAEFVIMFSLAILLRQFSRYELVLTPEGINIKFGRIKRMIPWMEIDSYNVITSGTPLNSGGWKIGLGKNGWYSMYTVINKPRVVLQLNTGKIRQVMFSTGQPEAVAGVIKRQTGKTPGADVAVFSQRL